MLRLVTVSEVPIKLLISLGGDKMALFREIPDKRVVCAWTMPSVRESDTFAVGTRVST